MAEEENKPTEAAAPIAAAAPATEPTAASISEATAAATTTPAVPKAPRAAKAPKKDAAPAAEAPKVENLSLDPNDVEKPKIVKAKGSKNVIVGVAPYLFDFQQHVCYHHRPKR